ncbi:hypothetical protein ACJMK2_014735, partial [Sinanodonta woodiana]
MDDIFRCPTDQCNCTLCGTKAIDCIYSKGLTPSNSTIAGTWHGKFFSHLFEFKGID